MHILEIALDVLPKIVFDILLKIALDIHLDRVLDLLLKITQYTSGSSPRYTSEGSPRFTAEDNFQFSFEDSFYSNTVTHEDKLSSKIPSCDKENASLNQLKLESFRDEKVKIAKSNTTSVLSYNIPTKCFVGGVQRKKKLAIH